MFILGVAAACLTVGWPAIRAGDYTHLFILLFALIFGVIGFLDDFAKVRRKRNLGLTSGQKLVLQVAVAVAFVLLLRFTGRLTPNLYVPFLHVSVKLPEPVYLVFAAFVIVAEVNAVNLTDGADGLCSGVTIPVFLCFAAVAAAWGLGSDFGAAGIFAAGLAGALTGFLLWNFHPAKLFMGDTGALFLGGAVCATAFALDMPLILLPLGIVYLLETLSDVIQVAYFKLSHGKRVFKMAPLHHHFELLGWNEYKLFLVFTSVSAIFAVISYFAVRLRYAVG
ncbi:MAG: phospho-N-acetylmuramoyl-pentapeptide-transferase, partial [Oscillospiraceae bacterium]|jgi:phospho-N-acetylmuramoyl-pentapeptide-transferase|nr:phospho-N-acetylmuramoyl-pentapeptide-transferase [Oscillospiraceae bacterium]